MINRTIFDLASARAGPFLPLFTSFRSPSAWRSLDSTPGICSIFREAICLLFRDAISLLLDRHPRWGPLGAAGGRWGPLGAAPPPPAPPAPHSAHLCPLAAPSSHPVLPSGPQRPPAAPSGPQRGWRSPTAPPAAVEGRWGAARRPLEGHGLPRVIH